MAGKLRRLSQGIQSGVSETAKHKIISDVVHQAVCIVTGGDGVGKAALYAWIGTVVASVILQRRFVVQCGSLRIWLTDSTAFEMNSENDGLSRGEFHCWCATMEEGGQIVDLSARHYRRLLEGIGLIQDLGEDCRWPSHLPEQEYIWMPLSAKPELAELLVDADQTQHFVDRPQVKAWGDPNSEVRTATSAAVLRARQRIEDAARRH